MKREHILWALVFLLSVLCIVLSFRVGQLGNELKEHNAVVLPFVSSKQKTGDACLVSSPQTAISSLVKREDISSYLKKLKKIHEQNLCYQEALRNNIKRLEREYRFSDQSDDKIRKHISDKIEQLDNRLKTLFIQEKQLRVAQLKLDKVFDQLQTKNVSGFFPSENMNISVLLNSVEEIIRRHEIAEKVKKYLDGTNPSLIDWSH